MAKDLTAESIFEGLRSAYPELDDPQYRKFLLRFLPIITFDMRGVSNVISGCLEVLHESPDLFSLNEDGQQIVDAGLNAASILKEFIGGVLLYGRYLREHDDAQ